MHALTLSPIQPLVIPVTPIRGESLIGLIARATNENVLSQPKILLEEVGISGLRPGCVGIHAVDFSERLAAKLGCAEVDVVARAHPVISGTVGGPNAIVLFGKGELIRGDLELFKRRISPARLETIDHHCSHWLNRLLPYCPESLELLVDHCHCGAELGWVRSVGIARCETCSETIRNPTPEHLPERLIDDYRFFAALISACPEQHQKALNALDPAITALSVSPRINLILRLGSICHQPQVDTRRTAAHGLPPLVLAEVCSLGTRMIRKWPHNFREIVGETLARCQSAGGDQHAKVSHALRTLTQAQYFRAETCDLIKTALPEASSNAGFQLSGSLRPVVRAAEACRLTSISTSKLHLLRDAGALSFVQIGGAKRTIAQYDREEVLRLAQCIRGSRVLLSAASRLGLPEYALEQLVCLGHLEQEGHRAIELLYDRPRCTAASLEAFFRDFEAVVRTDSAPPFAVPLVVAMRTFGSTAKSWGPVLAAIRENRLPVWSSGEGRLARKILIDPQALHHLPHLVFHEANYPDFRFGTTFPHGDVAEILNLTWSQVSSVEQEEPLQFHHDGMARYAPRSQVIDIAKKYVATSEVAWRIGCDSLAVRKVMRDHPEIERRAAGWDRASFDQVFGTPRGG